MNNLKNDQEENEDNRSIFTQIYMVVVGIIFFSIGILGTGYYIIQSEPESFFEQSFAIIFFVITFCLYAWFTAKIVYYAREEK